MVFRAPKMCEGIHCWFELLYQQLNTDKKTLNNLDYTALFGWTSFGNS